jgi:hypothetical protein
MIVVSAVVFIGGFIVMMMSGVLHVMLPMCIVAVLMSKYHFETVINFLFLF